MNAKEAAALSAQNYNRTQDAKDLDRALSEIKKAAESDLRRVVLSSLLEMTKYHLRRQGYTVTDNDGSSEIAWWSKRKSRHLMSL